MNLSKWFFIVPIVFFFAFAGRLNAQTYTVTVNTDDAWWSAKDAFRQYCTAIIYRDGIPIDTSGNYSYTWYFYSDYWGYWKQYPAVRQDNTYTVDTYEGHTIAAYVVVSDVVNHTFTNIQSSPTATYQTTNDSSVIVTFHAYQLGGGDIGTYVAPNHWRYTIGKWLDYYHGFLTKDEPELLRPSQNYIPQIGQKMDYWNGATSNINNYNTFNLSGDANITAQFNPLDGAATISTAVIDAGGASGGTISFMDPWLKDTTDQQFYTSPYGYHNLGMAAPFKAENAPFQLTTSSKYIGVFRGRNYGGSTPFYSVSAPMVQTINGSTAYFAGWTSSPANSARFQYPNSATTAVRLDSVGAMVIAQYKYYTITYNSTVPSGTWTTAGSVTIPSGVTLTVASGATLKFPSGTGLTVNGTLTANGATFTSQSGTWNGITVNASGSSLTGCTISSASNGVTYSSASSGTMQECTLQSCTNGVVIQGNSTPTLSSNTFTNISNYAIYVSSNGSGKPTIFANSVTSNYLGIYLYNSTALIRENSVSSNSYGIVCLYYSSPTSGSTGQDGGNTISSNGYGIQAISYSYPNFGGGNPSKGQYWGVCNNLLNNSTYNAYAVSSSGITAQFNWWGQYPPNTSKIYAGSGCYVDYSNAEPTSADCPLGGGAGPIIAAATAGTTPAGLSSASPLAPAIQAQMNNDFGNASSLYTAILKDTSAAPYHREALARLYNVFQTSKDSTILDTFAKIKSSQGKLSQQAEELLASSYAAVGRLSDAQALAEDLTARYPDTASQVRALVLLTSLRGYDHNYSDVSKSAFAELVQKYGLAVDRHLLLGLRTPDDAALPEPPSPAVNTAGSTDSSAASLASYPNPFNPSTQIRFTVKQAGFVSLKVYDMLGREVATLVNEVKAPGMYNVNWNASELASGIYFARLESAGKVAIQKLLYLK